MRGQPCEKMADAINRDTHYKLYTVADGCASPQTPMARGLPGSLRKARLEPLRVHFGRRGICALHPLTRDCPVALASAANGALLDFRNTVQDCRIVFLGPPFGLTGAAEGMARGRPRSTWTPIGRFELRPFGRLKAGGVSIRLESGGGTLEGSGLRPVA